MVLETIPFVSTTSAARIGLANSTSQQGQSIVSRSWHLSRWTGRRCLDVQRAHQPEQRDGLTLAPIAHLLLISSRLSHGVKLQRVRPRDLLDLWRS